MKNDRMFMLDQNNLKSFANIILIGIQKINRMGICSSAHPRLKRNRKDQNITQFCKQKLKNNDRNAGSPSSIGHDSTLTDTLIHHSTSSATQLPLQCLGEIIGVRLNVHLEREEEVVGVGCMISPRILLASDHFLHFYLPSELKFRPFAHPIPGTEIKFRYCLYPTILPKERKRTVFLHKRINFALFELESPTPSNAFLELGTFEEQNEDIMDLDTCPKIDDVIEETSRLLYFHTSQKILERGWPLLYKLHNKYYLIGLYSSPHTSDSILLNDRLVERFKSCEQRHCKTEEIASVEINEAMVEMPINIRSSGQLSDLLEVLKEIEKIDEVEQIAEIKFAIGTEYGLLGNLQNEKQYYTEALRLYLSCDDKQEDNIAALYHNLGICESQLNNTTLANEYLQKSLELKKTIADGSESVADTYNQLGIVCKKQNKIEEALAYYYQAYNIYSQIEYSEKMSMVLNNITLLNQEEQTHSTNQTKYRGILGILVKYNGQNCIDVAKVLFNLAIMESDCKNYGSAITYLSKAASIMKNLQLQNHYYYQKIAQEIEQIDVKVEQYGMKKEWTLKSKALLAMI